MASLKERREQFVSDLAGGSTFDIYRVTAVSAVSYFVWCVIKKKTDLFNSSSGLALIIDVFLNWNNLLLSTTIYSDNIPLLLVLNALPMLPIVFSSGSKKLTSRKILVNFKTLTTKSYLPFKSYITVYRAQMMVITCICIMAVDFRVFPRRFAKVETWGTSLMDLGVGSFVFSMGLISSRSYMRNFYTNQFNYIANIVKCIKGCIPIIILGFVRLISVKSVDYHEHVTEYGKHWNFFFTLACMPLLCAILSPLIVKLSPLVSSILIIFSYEYLLIYCGLLNFIIAAPRTDFVSSNREGIFSLFGYFAIFLNGLAIGSAILPVVSTPYNLFKIKHTKESLMKAYKDGKPKFALSHENVLLVMCLFYQILYYVIDTCYSYGVSRRTANLLYVIWVSAYNCTFLFLYKMIEQFTWGKVEVNIMTDEDDAIESDISALSSSEHVPVTLTAVNNNSLILFIGANLLTGLINLSYNTLDSKTWASVSILIIYQLILSGITLILYKAGIVIR